MSEDFRSLLGGSEEAQDVNGQLYDEKEDVRLKARSVILFTSALVFTGVVTLGGCWLLGEAYGHFPTWVVIPAVDYFTINDPEKIVIGIGGITTGCLLLLDGIFMRPFFNEVPPAMKWKGRIIVGTLMFLAPLVSAVSIIPLDPNFLSSDSSYQPVPTMDLYSTLHVVLSCAVCAFLLLHLVTASWLFIQIGKELKKESVLHGSEGGPNASMYEVYQRTNLPPIPLKSGYIKLIIIISMLVTCGGAAAITWRGNCLIEWLFLGWVGVFMITYIVDFVFLLRIIPEPHEVTYSF